MSAQMSYPLQDLSSAWEILAPSLPEGSPILKFRLAVPGKIQDLSLQLNLDGMVAPGPAPILRAKLPPSELPGQLDWTWFPELEFLFLNWSPAAGACRSHLEIQIEVPMPKAPTSESLRERIGGNVVIENLDAFRTGPSSDQRPRIFKQNGQWQIILPKQSARLLRWRVYDMQGNLAFEGEKERAQQIAIPNSMLPPAMYILVAKTERETHYWKVLIHPA